MPVSDTAVPYTNNLNTAVWTSDRKPTVSRVFPFRVKTKSCLAYRWDILCSYSVYLVWRSHFSPEDGASISIRNVSTHLPECKLSEPRRPLYKYLTPPKIYSSMFSIPVCRILNIYSIYILKSDFHLNYISKFVCSLRQNAVCHQSVNAVWENNLCIENHMKRTNALSGYSRFSERNNR
jgi:hypothetical protein